MNEPHLSDIDAKIRAALRQEDAELLEHFGGDASLTELLIETFRGRHRWLNVVGMVATCVILIVLIYFAYRYFNAESTRAMLAWATGFVVGFIWIALMKIWFWLEIQRNAVIREIKRLELQVANLSRRLESAK
jgi:uncharacterized membrane protein YciS (DUF1049 family)